MVKQQLSSFRFVFGFVLLFLPHSASSPHDHHLVTGEP